MRRYIVKVSRHARQQIRQELAWWTTHRVDAPRKLDDELKAVITMLGSFAWIGYRVRAERSQRVKLLRKTQFLLYYTLDEQAGVITLDRFVATKRHDR